MKQKQIQITYTDMILLKDRISIAIDTGQYDANALRNLSDRLSEAEIVSPNLISNKRVTLKSTVRFLEIPGDTESVCTLVLPCSSNTRDDEISVLSPLGGALLGTEVGDEIELRVPAGLLRVRVMELIYQPERVGHHL